MNQESLRAAHTTASQHTDQASRDVRDLFYVALLRYLSQKEPSFVEHRMEYHGLHGTRLNIIIEIEPR